MPRRKSKRIMARKGDDGKDREATPEGKGRGKRRESVGGALGLTPTKAKARNLEMAKAEEAALAAAARFDGLNVGK